MITQMDGDLQISQACVNFQEWTSQQLGFLPQNLTAWKTNVKCSCRME
jgi:RNA 3'-terminal phosphate cyclase